jgi:hypothetical protein
VSKFDGELIWTWLSISPGTRNLPISSMLTSDFAAGPEPA